MLPSGHTLKITSSLAGILIVVVCLVVLEVALRLVYLGFYQQVPFRGDLRASDEFISGSVMGANLFVHPSKKAYFIFKPDRFLLWRLKENYRLPPMPKSVKSPVHDVKTNSHGFRNKEITRSKPEGIYRIMCLGDSCTFGFGYNIRRIDPFPQRLEQMLNQRESGHYEVINCGVPGYSLRQGLEFYRRVARSFEPDMVILAFGDNDWYAMGRSDDQIMRYNSTIIGGLTFTLGRFECYKLLKYLLLRIKGGLHSNRAASNPNELPLRTSADRKSVV